MNEEFQTALQELTEYLVEILTEEQATIASTLLHDLFAALGIVER